MYIYLRLDFLLVRSTVDQTLPGFMSFQDDIGSVFLNDIAKCH